MTVRVQKKTHFVSVAGLSSPAARRLICEGGREAALRALHKYTGRLPREAEAAPGPSIHTWVGILSRPDTSAASGRKQALRAQSYQ